MKLHSSFIPLTTTDTNWKEKLVLQYCVVRSLASRSCCYRSSILLLLLFMADIPFVKSASAADFINPKSIAPDIN